MNPRPACPFRAWTNPWKIRWTERGRSLNLCFGCKGALVRLGSDFVWTCIGRHVLGKFPAAFGTIALDLAHSTGRHGAGFKSRDAAIAYGNLRAKPVGAIHPARGIKGHRRCDRALKLFSRTG